MSNHLGIARRVARVARAVRFWMRNESIRRLRGGGGLLFALPPREEKTRGFGRVANEARGKTRENCAEMCVLRAKTHIVRAVLEWTRSYAAGARCGLSRRGFSKTGFESAFSTTHTPRRPRFFSPVVGIIDAMRFTNTSTHTFSSSIFPRQKRARITHNNGSREVHRAETILRDRGNRCVYSKRCQEQERARNESCCGEENLRVGLEVGRSG